MYDKCSTTIDVEVNGHSFQTKANHLIIDGKIVPDEILKSLKGGYTIGGGIGVNVKVGENEIKIVFGKVKVNGVKLDLEQLLDASTLADAKDEYTHYEIVEKAYDIKNASVNDGIESNGHSVGKVNGHLVVDGKVIPDNIVKDLNGPKTLAEGLFGTHATVGENKIILRFGKVKVNGVEVNLDELPNAKNLEEQDGEIS